MSTQPPDDQNRTVTLRRLVKGGQQPNFVPDMIPSEPITLRFGPGRGTATKGVGSAWLMGSKYLPGSPFDMTYSVLKLRITTSTPNVWFAFTHSRYPGTFDVLYETAKGDDLTSSELDSPIMGLTTGTFRAYALGPGSTVTKGKGSAVGYQGVGSGGNFAIGMVLDLYPL